MLVKRFIIGILVLILSIIFCFSEFISFLPKSWKFIGIPMLALGICIVVNSFNWNSKYGHKGYDDMPKLSEEAKIELLYYSGLSNYKDNILRLFYCKQSLERIIIYKKCNFVKISKEKLEFYDEEEIMHMRNYGMWVNTQGNSSYYADECLAFKDIKSQLEGYEEIDKEKIMEIINNNYSNVV